MLSFNMALLGLSFLEVLFFPPFGNEPLFPGRSPSLENKPASGLYAEVFVWKEWLLPGRFSFCFTCYPDAAQTLALAQDHTMDFPSQDRLKKLFPFPKFGILPALLVVLRDVCWLFLRILVSCRALSCA